MRALHSPPAGPSPTAPLLGGTIVHHDSLGAAMATTIRLSDEAELRLAELAALLHLSKNAVIEKAVLEMDERTSRRVRVRTAFDVVRARDAELLERLSR